MLLLISLLPVSGVVAQELPQEFILPNARLGDVYRKRVLRDKYRLELDIKANAHVGPYNVV